MTRSTRAFALASLIALPGAALLYLLAALGLIGAWPAMVHLTIFGWITGMIFAVSYHTMPVFAARDFPIPWLIWAQAAAWIAGTTIATAGLLAGWSPAAAAGLLLELAAALIFVANTLLLFLHGRQRATRPLPPPIPDQPRVDRVGSQATRAAGIALPLALLLLLASRLGWISGAWVLPAEHLATLGWMMLMIVGVAIHVLPRFSGRATRGPAWARWQLRCHAGALALLVAGLGLGWPQVFAAGGALMALALALFAWNVWPIFDCSLQVAGCRLPKAQPPISHLPSQKLPEKGGLEGQTLSKPTLPGAFQTGSHKPLEERRR